MTKGSLAFFQIQKYDCVCVSGCLKYMKSFITRWTTPITKKTCDCGPTPTESIWPWTGPSSRWAHLQLHTSLFWIQKHAFWKSFYIARGELIISWFTMHDYNWGTISILIFFRLFSAWTFAFILLLFFFDPHRVLPRSILKSSETSLQARSRRDPRWSETLATSPYCTRGQSETICQ